MSTAPDECGCVRCQESAGPNWMMRFPMCSECGNKRCPKATDHDLACTGSNEPGQPGSVYSRPILHSRRPGSQQ